MPSKIFNLIDYKTLKIIMGILLIFLTAQVRIPLNPVPITLQTSGALLIALCYDKKSALQSIIGYIVLGSLGAPLFNGLSSGFSVLIGPTGGYLFGIVLCTYLVTTMREKFGDNSWLNLTLYSLIGSISVFVVGLPYLTLFVGIDNSLTLGLYPFIIPGIAKAIFTASTATLLKSIRHQ
jgi:biotin transport system substrate-specific component